MQWVQLYAIRAAVVLFPVSVLIDGTEVFLQIDDAFKKHNDCHCYRDIYLHVVM